MAKRKANAQWSGGLKGGNGEVALGSGVFTGPYSFKSRFEDDEPTATNPEELIGAAHSACYSMQLSAMLEAAGTPPESVRTAAEVELRVTDAGPRITSIKLSTTGRVPGIDAATFEKTAQEAKEACLISQALAAVPDISVEASFEGPPHPPPPPLVPAELRRVELLGRPAKACDRPGRGRRELAA